MLKVEQRIELKMKSLNAFTPILNEISDQSECIKKRENISLNV